MFVKQGLVGALNSCTVTRGDLEVTRLQWQLPADILQAASGVLDSATVQKIQVLRDTGTCLKPHSQWPPSASFWMPEPQFFHFDY